MQELLWFTKYWKDFIVVNLCIAIIEWVFQLRMTQKQVDEEFNEETKDCTNFRWFLGAFEM